MSEPVRAEDGFVRVHPLSPLIRGGLVMLGVLGYLVSQQLERIAGAFSDAPGDEGGRTWGLLQVGGVGIAVVGACALGLMSWWFTRYRLGEESLEMHSGAVFRQHRQVRYDRIQSVDLVRPLLARLVGVSEVRVESAGGGDSHVSIAYLRSAEAEGVRERLLGLAGRSRPPAAGEDPSDPASAARVPVGRQILTVPPGRLVASVVLSWEGVLTAVFVVAAVVLMFFDLAPVIGGFLPIVVINAGRALLRLTRWYGLTIARREETLTSQRGLTDTRTSSVPLRRVQAVAISQSVLWRRAGWWSLSVNVAGAQMGSSSDSDADSVLVPVATTREVLALLEVVTGDAGTTAEVASLIDATPAGFVGQPRRARWLHPFAHRRIGYLAGASAVITRTGWAEHRLQVAPWGRIQSLTVHQGPVGRRMDLAGVSVISTVGPVSPSVKHLSRADAEQLGHLAGALSSHARRGANDPVGCDSVPDTVDCDR